jgi:hypothetical protein
VSRTAAATKEYADAACEVGAKLNIPVINLWKAFMTKAAFQVDVWKTGDHLPGSLAIPQDDALVKLMYDGEVLDRHTHSSLTVMQDFTSTPRATISCSKS